MQDVRDAIRALRAAPVVAAVAVLSLAFGIGANSAIFSILNSLLLRELPVRDPGQLAIVRTADNQTSWTNPIWEQIRSRQELFGSVMAWSATRFNLSQGGETEFVDGVWASGSYFDLLGVPPVLGRVFTPDDDRRGGGPAGAVAVISHGFWQRRFAGAADVIGRVITVERVPFTIVGVTPPDFFGTEVGRTFDIVIPLGTEPLIRGKESTLDRRSTWWLNIMIRLKEGQSIDAGSAALSGIQPQIREATMPEQYRPQDRSRYLSEAFLLTPSATGQSRLRTRYERPLTVIMVVVALVLLIACANIANLLLARAAARRHEISVRLALGASRARLVRLLLSESLMLSLLGATLGLVFAYWGSRLLVKQLSSTTSTVFLDLSLDWRVLLFTTLVAVGTAILFGMAPALRASRVQPNESLKEQGRGNSTDRRFSAGNLLVVAQVALSLILIVAAGLFMRTFAGLEGLDLGFDRRGAVVVTVNAQPLRLEPDARGPLFERIREAALATPGVEQAALSVVTPVSGSTWNDQFVFPHLPDLAERERVANVNYVSPGFFGTFRTALLAGRDFTGSDRAGAPKVIVVNESFARKYFAGENPVGRMVGRPAFDRRPAEMFEIVGYVRDAAYRSLREPMSPTVYLPLLQNDGTPSSISLTVRAAAGAPSLLIKPLAASVGGVHRELALTFRPLEEQVDAALTQERIVAMLSGFFGGLALLLAGLGLYGVTSYAVNRRRSELGIRMALGAAPGSVVRLVLRRVALLVGCGLAVGVLLLVVFVTSGERLGSASVSALLFGVELRDPLTFATGSTVLALIGAFAGWIPARRASRIDPATVLRQ